MEAGGRLEGLRLDRVGGVAVITVDAPPVNALGGTLRAGLVDVLDRLSGDGTVQTVVLRAEGPLFSAGADIREFDAPRTAPRLGDICRRIELWPVPVIAVMQGAALGGGAELALAAHYRLAGPAARIGLPEVRLGLIPGAGGTQRLPRLIGAEAAFLLMSEGHSLDAAAAEEIGLVDGVLSDTGLEAVASFAEGLVARGVGPRPTLAMTDMTAEPALWLAAVAEARQVAAQSPVPAVRRLCDCVEAALLLPPEAGLALEEDLFGECLAGAESRALRHLFLAERRLPAALGTREAGGEVVLSAAGTAVAARLHGAILQASQALARDGAAREAIAAALGRMGLGDEPAQPGGQGGAALERALMGAVVAEGGRMIDEGTVPGAAAVDVIAVAGAGWPRLSGGPMHRAAQAGLAGMLRTLESLAEADGVWDPPGVLREAAKFAGGFAAVGDRRQG